MIEEQFVSFDTAKMLKEAGFKANCAFILDDNQERLYRPTQALAARWLREVHGLFIEIFYRITGFNYEIIYTRIDDVAFTPHEPKINFISYEGCLEDALQEAVKLIKK